MAAAGRDAKPVGLSGGEFQMTPHVQHFLARPARAGGYMLIEALVYIGAVVVLVGVGFIAMHRCVDRSVIVRRNADDIAHTVHIGELWRQDVRSATRGAGIENAPGEQLLHLLGPTSTVDYLFTQGGVYRRVASGPWSCVLDKVKDSVMRSDPRPPVVAWTWDVELLPEARGSAAP